jgi:CheY-like chemotaxis protein
MRENPESGVLVVADDNRDTREMYAVYLSMLGYRVAVASNGREAVVRPRCAPEPHPDGPRDAEDGRLGSNASTTERRRDNRNTGDCRNRQRLQDGLKDVATAAGAASYLMKPCFPEELAREVTARLAVRRARIAGAS